MQQITIIISKQALEGAIMRSQQVAQTNNILKLYNSQICKDGFRKEPQKALSPPITGNATTHTWTKTNAPLHNKQDGGIHWSASAHTTRTVSGKFARAII